MAKNFLLKKEAKWLSTITLNCCVFEGWSAQGGLGLSKSVLHGASEKDETLSAPDLPQRGEVCRPGRHGRLPLLGGGECAPR